MPERTDAICNHLKATINHPYQLIVVDNGSDIAPISKYTRFVMDTNKQTTGGFRAGVNYALQSSMGPFDYYWFIITSAEFNVLDFSDPLDYLLPLFGKDDTFVVHPAVTFNYSPWSQWMSPREPGNERRRVWGVDYIAALMDAEKYHAIGGFRPELTMAWGLSGECNWKARKEGWKIYVNDTYVIHKETDIGYSMNRMNMSANERKRLAGAQSDRVLTPIYGPDYRERFRYEYTELGTGGDY